MVLGIFLFTFFSEHTEAHGYRSITKKFSLKCKHTNVPVYIMLFTSPSENKYTKKKTQQPLKACSFPNLLSANKSRVSSLGGDKLCVSSSLYNPPAFYQEDNVRILDRGQTVGNDNTGSTLLSGVKSGLNQLKPDKHTCQSHAPSFLNLKSI